MDAQNVGGAGVDVCADVDVGVGADAAAEIDHLVVDLLVVEDIDLVLVDRAFFLARHGVELVLSWLANIIRNSLDGLCRSDLGG